MSSPETRRAEGGPRASGDVFELLAPQEVDEVPWQYAGREQGGEVERLSLSFFLSYPPPRELNANTPEPLSKIIYRCLTVMDYGLVELERDLVDFLRRD